MVVDDSRLLNQKLEEWERFNNFDRPHGSRAGQTPYGRLRQSTQARV